MKLSEIVQAYADKRRGEEVKAEFDVLKNNFKICIESLIKENKLEEVKSEMDKPFVMELFNKYVDYSFSATKEEGVIVEAKTMDELLKKIPDLKEKKYPVEMKEIKMKEAEAKKGKFLLYKQWWKHKNKESVLIEKFIISTDLGIDIYLNKDPLAKSFTESEPGTFYTKLSKEITPRLTESIKFLPVGNKLNVTLMASWIKKMSAGEISISESSDMEKTIKFSDEKLNGVFIAKRDSGDSDFWSLTKKT